jgi:3-phosphoglycerate kinase
MHDTARAILARAKASNCEIVLPVDAVTATELKPNAADTRWPSGTFRRMP